MTAHWHCAQACADKLDIELTKYGVPPKFPTDEEVAAAEEAKAAQEAAANAGAEVRRVQNMLAYTRERTLWRGTGGTMQGREAARQ
jgi:hypothetical protein